MHPVLFQIGEFRVGSYGVMLALAFLAADAVFRRELLRRGLGLALAAPLFLAAVIGGVVGGKALHVLDHWDRFTADPLGLLFGSQGLAAYGGFILAIALCLLIIRRSGQPAGPVFDAAAPALALAYGIARIGCQLAGDGCYGTPSELPWAMSYPDGIVPTIDRVHPTPLYELAWSLGVFAILWHQRVRLQPRPFALFFAFLLLAGAGRFGVEFIRLNPVGWGGLTTSQWLASGMVMAGLVFFVRRAPGPELRANH